MRRLGITSYIAYLEYIDLENVYSISGAKYEFMYDRVLVWDTYHWKQGQEELGLRLSKLWSLLGFKYSFSLPCLNLGVGIHSYVWCIEHRGSKFALRLDENVLHFLFPKSISPEEVEQSIVIIYDKLVNPKAWQRLRLKARWFKG